jgi:hypothetical protein
MSIAVMSAVWRFGPQDQGELLVMLALADHSDDDGASYPSMARIGRKARMSERNARRIVRKLEVDGWLTVDVNAGPRGSNIYRITPDKLSARTDCPPDKSTADPGQNGRDTPDTAMSAEPSRNHHSLEPSGALSAKASPRGSRLPEDWTPNEEQITYAQQKGMTDEQIERTAADFADYWIAKPGKDGQKADWDRTWQRWVRTEVDRGGPARLGNGRGRDPRQIARNAAAIAAARRMG